MRKVKKERVKRGMEKELPKEEIQEVLPKGLIQKETARECVSSLPVTPDVSKGANAGSSTSG
jgi:hypothetical protein